MKPLTAAATLLTAITIAPVLLLAILTPMLASGAPSQQTLGMTHCNGRGESLPASSRLTPQQLQRAAIIHATAMEAGLGPRAAVVGIATAIQESTLGADPRSRRPDTNHNIGLFQQRVLPGWHADGNTVAENITILLDDHYQTRVFFTGRTTTNGWHIPGLADIPNWQDLPVTQAAQQVQVSAYPNAYAKHEPLAQAIVSALSTSNNGQLSAPCHPGEVSSDCSTTPAAVGSERGLTPDAVRVMRCVAAGWPEIRSIGGLRPGDPRDHGTGRAVDVMIPNWNTPTGHALGGEIAAWARTNATTLGVTYIIWDRQIWSLKHHTKGWRPCSQGSCYAGPNPSAAHRDHVHISVTGNQGIESNPDTVVLPVAKGHYRISARFGQPGTRWTNRHTGLDFAAPTGTPIQAVTSGTVTTVHNAAGAYGMLTKIRADDGTEVWYAHQDRTDVHQGQHVTAGQVIGAVGATGNATGPHLHLEIRTSNGPADPLNWLQDHGAQP